MQPLPQCDGPQPLSIADLNTGLFECFQDNSSCLEGCFCPYCQVSQEYNMLTRRERSLNYIMCCMMMLCDASLTFGGALLIGNIVTRGTLREKMQMRNVSGMVDCLAATFCLFCSSCQTYREMSMRNWWPGGVCVSEPYRNARFVMPPNPATMFSHGPIVMQGQAMQVQPNSGPQMQGQGYGPVPQPGYAPSPNYGVQAAYGQAPGVGYGQPVAPGYGQPPAPVGYGQPPPSYGQAPVGYGPPPAGYPPR